MIHSTPYKILLFATLAIAAVQLHYVFFSEINEKKNPSRDTRIQMDRCAKEELPERCYRNLAINLLNTASLHDAMNILENMDRSDSLGLGVQWRCHTLTHFLGQEVYLRDQSLAAVYQQCSTACGGGCYHGAMERYFQERHPRFQLEGNELLIAGEVKTICGKRTEYEFQGLYHQCVHGVGHALMFITDGDLIRSLAFCDALEEKDRKLCYSGAFMENVVSATVGIHPSRFLKKDDPFYPCNALGEEYRKECYRYQSSHFVSISNYDWKKVAELCQSVPLPYRVECFIMYGGNQVANSGNPKFIKAGCDLIRDSGYRNECVKGAVFGFASRYNERFLSYALKFCAFVDQENKESCYRQIGHTLTLWTKNNEAVVRICEETQEKQIAQWCKLGAYD